MPDRLRCSVWNRLRGRGLRQKYPRLTRVLGTLFPGVLTPLDCKQLDGYRLYVDRCSDALLEHGMGSGRYEPAETDFLKSVLAPGSTFLDVGANVGCFTCLASRIVGATGKVYSFEPDRDNYRILRKNVRCNRCANTAAVRAAVSDRTGWTLLYRSEINHGHHTIYDGGEGRRAVRTRCVALDDYLPANMRVDCMKMDVEGAELFALRGMRRLVEGSRDRIAVLSEFSPNMLSAAGCEPLEFLTLLESCGLRLWDLSGEPHAAPDMLRLVGREQYISIVAAREWPPAACRARASFP